MWPFDKLKNLAVRKFVEKYVKAGVKSGVAFAAVWLAQNAGVQLTPEQQAGLTVALIGAIFAVTNNLKHRYPDLLWWL